MLIEEENAYHELGYGPVNLFKKEAKTEVKLTWKQRKPLSRQAKEKALKKYNEKYTTENT